MKKRVVALLLTAGMILGSLTGCGQTKQESGVSEENQKTEEAQSTSQSAEAGSEEQEEVDYDPFGKYEEGITLTVACDSESLKFDSTQDGYASLDDNVWTRAYEEELGISLDYIWTAPGEEYTTKWNVSITADDIPDVAVVPASIYQQLLAGGYVEDMTEYYENYASDTYKAAVDADGGVAKSAVTVEGRLMGLPHPGKTPDDIEFLFIRKDWLDELNLEVPNTLDELLDVARAFKDAKMGGENTVAIAAQSKLKSTGLGNLGGILEAYGVHLGIWVEDENGNLVYGDVQPEVKEALKTLQEMYAEELIPQDFAAATSSVATSLVTSGQCGIAYGAYWTPSGIYNQETMELDDWIITEGVTADGSDFIGHGSATPSNYLFVKKGVENPEAVVKMINLQFELRKDAEVYEGYTYKLDDGTEAGISSLYYCLAPYLCAPWKNEMNQKIIAEALETGDDSQVMGTSMEKTYLEVKSVLDEDNNDPLLSYAWGLFGPEGTFSIVNNMWDEDRIYVNKFVSSYSEFAQQNIENMQEILYAEYFKIIMGADIDNFDKAVEIWMQTGGERITQEVNEWYQSTK